jgi:hypothetical protein
MYQLVIVCKVAGTLCFAKSGYSGSSRDIELAT